MGLTSSRIFPQISSPDIFTYPDIISKIRSTETQEYLSHPILTIKDTKSFYTLEQIMTLSNDEMKDLCKTRGIEELNEIAIIDWQIENLFTKVRFKNSQCKTDEMSLEFYTYEDINKFLRYIFGLPEKFYYPFIGGYNINILHCIYKLDNMIMNGKRGDINKYYYRGLSKYELFIVEHCINSREEYKKVIYKGKECLLPSFNEYGFSSVSTSRTVVSRFTGYNCCVLKFKLLKDIKCVDVINTTEKETILQRNLVYYDFKKIDDFKGKLMFECKIRRNPILLDDFYNEEIEKKLDEFCFIGAFVISSKKIDSLIKDVFIKYKVRFNKSNEIYRPPNSLKEFVDMIGEFLKTNDAEYQLKLAREEIVKLKTELYELQKKIVV